MKEDILLHTSSSSVGMNEEGTKKGNKKIENIFSEIFGKK